MMKTIAALVFFCVFQLIVVGPAAAYIDPGTTRLVSQVLYVLFYSALAACFYFFRYFVSFVTGLEEFRAKFLGRWLQR